MAWTQANLDAYDAAIQAMLADGLPKSIVSGDRAITYNSVAELIEARNLIASLVAQDSGATTGRSTLASFSRGTNGSAE